MIRVPLQNQQEETKFVEIEQTKLPDDVSEMISFLSQEKAGIAYWLEISVSIDILILLTSVLFSS